MIHDAIKGELLLLYSLGKKQEDVVKDTQRGVKNITDWLDMVFKGNKNQFGLTYKNFVASEQEFNT